MILKVENENIFIDSLQISFIDLYALTGSRKLWIILKAKAQQYGTYSVRLSRGGNSRGVPPLFIHPTIYRVNEEYIDIDTKDVWLCKAINDRGEVLLSNKTKLGIMSVKNNERINCWTIL